ncbi:regulatory for the arginine catabolic pathway [Fusarium albosuccineum]|uniref:Regulatory for the arginine catabolic pathway n=1 Tax=Fusarium albosuccineum TaxID=1237068 RepID=A0A8H4L0C0_9HYPO|nr:regulatory for the arginine catabolic pathway [Fusarium albosuccineum]
MERSLGRRPGRQPAAQPVKKTRTRSGCLNCRRKKRKCDEGRPACGTCRRRNEHCEWGLKLTFRAENAQGLDGRHPSMRKLARRRPREFEILDVTSEVIRDYNAPVSLLESEEDDIDGRRNGHSLSSNATSSARPPRFNGLSNGTENYFSAQTPTIIEGSPSSQRQTESAVADLLYFSQSGQAATAQHHARVEIDPALVSMDMEYPYIEQIQAFTPEGMSEDGIFLPGSAYHELHSTLRQHLIQETRSAVPTRSVTPRLEDDSVNGSSTMDETEVTLQVSDFQPSAQTPLLSDEAECALWKNYFDEIAPWLDKFDRDRHFQQILPTMTKGNDHLRYSMLALSARQLELKKTLPTDRSLALYQEAIHLLLPHLPTRGTAVIATCVILCVLEMLSCSPKAWQRHLDGCASLMEAVGINGFVGGTEQALFWCFARMDVCGGLISSVKTLIPVSHWASGSIEADVDLFRNATGFEQWANYSVYLIAQVLDLLAPLPSETLQAPTRNDSNFRARWLKLWKYICDWHEHRPAPLHPIMTIPSNDNSPFPTILFSNPAAISGNQLHHTASILMLQNQPSAVRLSLSAKPRSILWHARQVCGISISNDHHGAWTNGIQPLWIAGRSGLALAQDRIIGTLFGSALGDAIGLYTEFLSAELSAKAYPDRTFTLLPSDKATPFRRDRHRNFHRTGEWTDDTDHAMLILLSFLHSDGKKLDPQDFASRLSVWVRMGLRALDTLPLGLGRTVGGIVRSKSYLDDPEGTARDFWTKSKYNAAPNGSLMRTHPLGLMCLDKSLEDTFKVAADYSIVTHVDPRCIISCVVGTALVRGLVLGEVRTERHVDEMIEAGLKWYNARREQELKDPERKDEPHLDVDEFRTHATAKTLADLKLDDSYKIGYVYKTFGSGILLLRLAMRQLESAGQLRSQLAIFEKLITDLIMEGGDADTNACFAGALLGGLLGFKALPPHWRDGLRHGTWLMEKSEGLCDVLGITKGSYIGSRDKDTAEDGGRGFLTDAQMEERCMLMQAWMVQEEQEWNRKQEADKKKPTWFSWK